MATGKRLLFLLRIRLVDQGGVESCTSYAIMEPSHGVAERAKTHRCLCCAALNRERLIKVGAGGGLTLPSSLDGIRFVVPQGASNPHWGYQQVISRPMFGTQLSRLLTTFLLGRYTQLPRHIASYGQN